MTKGNRSVGNDTKPTFQKSIFMLLFGVLLLFAPVTARSHAYPDHSDPKVGATISSSPAQVRIWFDSNLEPAFSTIMVHDADNVMVDKRDGHVDQADEKLLEVSVPSLPPGTYRVIWSVVARDGHRTEGDYRFTIK